MLAIDWGLAVAASMIFFSYNPFATSLIFVVMQILFIPTIGGSIGHRLFGLRIVPFVGGGSASGGRSCALCCSGS